MSEPRGHAFGLDAIRAVAVASVLLAHGSLFYTGAHPGARYFLVVFGVLGVEIFFALSGFLVGRQLLLVAEGRATATRFLVRRWVRTLPNYYLFLAVNAALVLWVIDRQHADGRFLVFAQALAWPATSAFFPESWSLAVEEWFYLLAALAFAGAALGRASPRALAIGLAALLVAGPLARFAAQSLAELPMDAGVRKISLLRLDSLAYGLACAGLERHAAPIFARLKRAGARIAAIALAALGIAFLVRASTDLAFFAPAKEDVAGRAAAALLFTALPLAAALFLPWLSAWNPAPRAGTRAVEALSAWSYSIYLVHFPLLLVLVEKWRVDDASEAAHGRTLAWLAGTLVIAALVYVLYERPLMRHRPALIPPGRSAPR